MKKWNIIFTCLLCLSLVVNVHYCKETNKPAEVRVETRTEYVTIMDTVPTMVEIRTTGETVTLNAKVKPVVKTTGVETTQRHATNREPDGMVKELDPDTVASVCIMGDSATVTLPVEQRVYKDSLYTAYVSGYRPRLDSITIRLPHTYTTVTKMASKPTTRWVVGPTVGGGYGIVGRQMDMYVGVGVTWNILP